MELGPFVYAGHYALLRHVMRLNRRGVALEFGVGSGESARIIAERHALVTFGSTEGLPEDWRDGFPKGSFAFPLPEIDGVTVIEGWFEDTLPQFAFHLLGPARLIHFDADLYSSTATALKWAAPCIEPGTILVFDEFHNYPGCEDHEQRAWREFIEKTDMNYTVLGHSQEAWAVRMTE